MKRAFGLGLCLVACSGEGFTSASRASDAAHSGGGGEPVASGGRSAGGAPATGGVVSTGGASSGGASRGGASVGGVSNGGAEGGGVSNTGGLGSGGAADGGGLNGCPPWPQSGPPNGPPPMCGPDARCEFGPVPCPTGSCLGYVCRSIGTGGAPGTGGASSGGATSTGGASTGGVTSTGGTRSTGGTGGDPCVNCHCPALWTPKAANGTCYCVVTGDTIACQ